MIEMDPSQVENSGNLANTVIVRHCLIKTERIEEMLLAMVEPPHHRLPPKQIKSARRNHRSWQLATASATKSATRRHERGAVRC